jgi:hypothetical protein
LHSTGRIGEALRLVREISQSVDQSAGRDLDEANALLGEDSVSLYPRFILPIAERDMNESTTERSVQKSERRGHLRNHKNRAFVTCAA